MPAHVLVLARPADRYLVDNIIYHLHLVMQKNSNWILGNPTLANRASNPLPRF